MKTAFKALMLTAGLFAATPATAAKPQLAETVADKPSVTLDPSSSYILVQVAFASGMFATPLTLIRRPTDAELADYRQRRAIALEKAHRKWVKAHADWQAVESLWLAAKDKATVPDRQTEPVEPTDANLDFTPIEVETMITIGPFNRFAKNKATDRSVYLTRVQPGRYAVYGPVNITANGAFGTCLCMGSVEFDVGPGQIIDAGTMRLNLMERYAGKVAGPKPRNELDLPEGVTSVGWDAPANSSAIDPRLASYHVISAQLRPGGPFNNYFGLQIDRLTAIPGVLEYNRDRIVDPRAGATAASH